MGQGRCKGGGRWGRFARRVKCGWESYALCPGWLLAPGLSPSCRLALSVGISQQVRCCSGTEIGISFFFNLYYLLEQRHRSALFWDLPDVMQPGELEAPWDLGGAFEVPQCLPILTRELPNGSLIFPLLEVFGFL